MNATAPKLREVPKEQELQGQARLALLRAPFAPNAISKLPKPSKKQTDELKADFRKGQRCNVCGGWHQPDVVHLDYVGHAALTDRLLDVDPLWSWEPMSFTSEGQPAFDKNGGLWIRLTVCGVTRLGYGSADGKSGGDAVKEIIGDALRNAAMRFGAALDLWHKGDLHVTDEPAEGTPPAVSAMEKAAAKLLSGQTDPAEFKAVWEKNKAGWKSGLDPEGYARIVGIMKTVAAQLQAKAAPEPQPAAEDFGIGDDEIPF